MLFYRPTHPVWAGWWVLPYTTLPVLWRMGKHFVSDSLVGGWGLRGRVFGRLGPYYRLIPTIPTPTPNPRR